MIPVCRWDDCVLPLDGLNFVKCRFLFQFFKYNHISGATLGYHLSNEECYVRWFLFLWSPTYLKRRSSACYHFFLTWSCGMWYWKWRPCRMNLIEKWPNTCNKIFFKDYKDYSSAVERYRKWRWHLPQDQSKDRRTKKSAELSLVIWRVIP
jgi:hypothetical protein